MKSPEPLAPVERLHPSAPALAAAAATATPSAKPSRLWLWFVAVACLQAAAWTTWFMIAAQHKVQEVPLVTASPAR